MLLLDVLYRELVDTFEKIEKTSKRLEITDYLSNLFKKIPSDIIDKVVYLIKGGLHPDYLGIELGIAEKLTIKSISAATSIPEEDILKKWQEIGDLGTVTEILISNQTKEEESKKILIL